GVDLALRLTAIRDPKRFPEQVNRQGVQRIRDEAARLRRMVGDKPALSPGGMASGLSRPDRVAAQGR
ncbi:hypothetical protein MGSAQ_001385, partial [marine sediment metagenome]